MIALVVAVGGVATAFIVQLLWFRSRLPARQTRALLGVFGVVLAVEVAVGRWLEFTPAEVLAVATFHIACTLGWMITWSAVEADSPTLVLVATLWTRGPLDRASLASAASNQVLVRPRIDDLVRDRHLELRDNTLVLTPKGRRFISIFTIHRRMLARPRRGG